MKEASSNSQPVEPLIDRREFIGGVVAAAVLTSPVGAEVASVAEKSTAIADSTSASASATAATASSPYPPALTGLRGQYPGSFEIAHAARDGEFNNPVTAENAGERYDLVVVGGGISGLSSAYFFRQA